MVSRQRVVPALLVLSVACLILAGTAWSQYGPTATPGYTYNFGSNNSPLANRWPGSPAVVHVHHHYNGIMPGSANANLVTGYAPIDDWKFGFQQGTGTFFKPWQQDWGHLGFTGYMGQQGKYVGLVVASLTPGSPAAKMGLISGDFILEINGQPLTNYKQVTVLFDQTEEKPNAPLELEVWNPQTNRVSELSNHDGDDNDDDRDDDN